MDWKKTFGMCLIAMAFVAPCGAVSLDDFAVGATYRMTLTTGDVLEGVIDSKTDTSLILDTKEKPYSFEASLISEYQLLAPPKTNNSAPAAAAGTSESEPVTYDNVKQRQPGTSLEVKLTGGSLFRGKLVSVDDENLKLDVDGSVIPIAQKVIDKIAVVSVQKTPEKPAAASASEIGRAHV
jgi:ribosome maturation factor RimP